MNGDIQVMSSIINAVPKVILEGIEDRSTRVVPREPEQYPMHLPQFFSIAEKGPSKNQLVSGSDGQNIFGHKTFDPLSEYGTFVTPFCNATSGQGNSFMFKRLIPEDALKSTIVLWLKLTPAKFPVSKTMRSDSDDGTAPEPDPEIEGFTIKWELREAGSQIPGQEKSEGDNEYPIMEFHASSQGVHGDNIAFSLSVPTTDSVSQPDVELASHNKVMVLRISMLERADALSSPVTIVSLNGTNTVDFVLKPGVTDKYNIEKYIDDIVVPSYHDVTTPNLPPVYGPIDVIHFYRSNHLEVAQKIYDAEVAAKDVPGVDLPYDITEMDIEQMNYYSGVTINNDHFVTLDTTIENGGAVIVDMAKHYLTGGKDGDISVENINKMVSDLMTSGWDMPDDPLADMATNPFSCIWDCGFEMETKKLLCEALGRRKDVSVILATHVHGDDVLNWEEEESVASILKGYAANYPESVIHGTPVCRALVVAGSGYLINGTWKPRVPVSVDLIDKVAAFMGAGSGIMADGKGFDIAPNNQVSLLRDITGLYKTERQRQKDWDAGMVWAQSYNRRSAFYAAVQTVYPDDTSVLNSAINMFIAVELQKVCDYVWKNLSGNAKLTNPQFIDRSNEMITQRTSNRFDNRVVIVPDTFYTAADVARGYSWSCKINMYASNMKTVGTFTVVSHRLEDLAA